VSGSTTRSVCPASGCRSSAKRARLPRPSCQASGCCTSETRRVLMGSTARRACGEVVEPRGCLIQRAVAFGDAQPHEAERLGLGIEGRERDGGHARLRQQPLGKGTIFTGAKCAEVEELEIRALRGRQRETGALEGAAQSIALRLEKRRQSLATPGLLVKVAGDR